MYKFNIRLQLMIIFIRDKSAYYFVRVKQNSAHKITSVVSSCTFLTIYVKMNLQNINFCLILWQNRTIDRSSTVSGERVGQSEELISVETLK